MKMGTTDSKAQAELLKRKVKFITNILVVKDPMNPQNEGKVFLWEFGTKLNGKFLSAMDPSLEDISLGAKPKELFNPFDGSNILLKIKKASGFFNYDDTEVMESSSIVESEEEYNELVQKTHRLREFISPEHFGTYDELKIKLDKVLNGSKSEYISATNTASTANNSNDEKLIKDTYQKPVETVRTETPKAVSSKTVEVNTNEDIDDLLSELDNM